MRKIFINLILILLLFIIYFLQANFFNFFTIAGIKPNLFIIYILFIGLFGNRTTGIIYSIVIGTLLDLLFQETMGPNLLGFVLTIIVVHIFNKNLSKDSRITIMFMVLSTTIFFEIISYFISYILYSVNFELLNFVKILLIETIYNILITIIIYPLMQRFGYYIENEYVENKILTRYF